MQRFQRYRKTNTSNTRATSSEQSSIGRQFGFTLIELMIAVAILAVLIRVAAPSMRDMVVNSRLQGVSSDLVADLSLARGTAAAKGQRVTICQSTNGTTCTGGSTWQEGWIVFVDADSNGTYNGPESATPGIDTMIKVHEATNSSVTVAPYSTTGTPPALSAANTGITSVRYRPSGSTTGTVAIGFRVCQTGFVYRDIVISTLGRISSSVSGTRATAQDTTSCS
jgi:prepilin-type N-terminal cleavage/methylation domain-containing protein